VLEVDAVEIRRLEHDEAEIFGVGADLVSDRS
jgi:hypothetical protein